MSLPHETGKLRYILMNNTFDAIVNPVVTKNTPDPGNTAILVSSTSDLNPLVRSLEANGELEARKLFMSHHYLGTCGTARVSLVGPIMGAPYAVALLDTLVAWGVKQLLFLGWCGSVSSRVAIGDIIVPDLAFIDEGTSRHYGAENESVQCPPGRLPELVIAGLERSGGTCRRGAVWTTDAIYRETEQQVRRFQEKGALAVEMEVSALFSAAHFRGVEISSLLVTSDRLHDMQWQPGFRDKRFTTGRQQAVNAILNILPQLQDLVDG